MGAHFLRVTRVSQLLIRHALWLKSELRRAAEPCCLCDGRLYGFE